MEQFKGREERAKCYQARDAFFECHEKQPKSTETKVGACKQLYEQFQKACGQQWTEHFLRKHSYLKFKDKLIREGVESLDKDKL